MDKNGEIALNELIDEGKSIEKGISYVAPPSNVWRTYNVYKFADYQIFETWKNKCLRFLSREFEGDRCIKDFENVIQDISDRSYPIQVKQLIAILESCVYVSKLQGKG